MLWVGAQALALLLTRLPLGEGNLAASGVRGIGMSFRAFIVGIPLVAITVADARVGLAAAILYVIAYTLELAVSLITFFGREACVKRLLASGALFLVLPQVALASSATGAEEKFNPASEWTLHEWVPIHLGPLDLSINKAVAYLLLGALVSCLIGIVLMRVKVGSDPTRKQALGETIYEVAQVQVAEQGCRRRRSGAGSPTWRR